MAVFLRRNLTSFLVVLFLLAAYPSEVRTKPTFASPVENDAASHDLEKAKSSKTHDSGFYINLDSETKDLSEDSKNIKPVQKKKLEGSTEKSKQSKFEDSSREEKSKSKNQDSSLKAEKKSNKKAETAPEDVLSDYTDEQTSGWDVDSVLAKDDSQAPIPSEQDISNFDDKKEGSEDSAKDNETVPNKKSKASKSDKSSLSVTTEDYSEALPTAAGQKLFPTTTSPTSTTTQHSKGSASTNLPRALCSFVVTVCTVLVML